MKEKIKKEKANGKTKIKETDPAEILLAKGYELAIVTKSKAIVLLPGGKREVHRMDYK